MKLKTNPLKESLERVNSEFARMQNLLGDMRAQFEEYGQITDRRVGLKSKPSLLHASSLRREHRVNEQGRKHTFRAKRGRPRLNHSVLLNFKLSERDRRKLIEYANKYVNGNVSAWLRLAAINFKPDGKDFLP